MSPHRRQCGGELRGNNRPGWRVVESGAVSASHKDWTITAHRPVGSCPPPVVADAAAIPDGQCRSLNTTASQEPDAPGFHRSRQASTPLRHRQNNSNPAHSRLRNHRRDSTLRPSGGSGTRIELFVDGVWNWTPAAVVLLRSLVRSHPVPVKRVARGNVPNLSTNVGPCMNLAVMFGSRSPSAVQ